MAFGPGWVYITFKYSTSLQEYQQEAWCVGAERASVGLCAAAQAPLVLGVFGEKDPACHAVMWEMLFAYLAAFPDCWAHTNPSKAVLPRLYAFLRHGCHGSACGGRCGGRRRRRAVRHPCLRVDAKPPRIVAMAGAVGARAPKLF